eukprot:866487-Prorocentrum_minimum.AAC.1
MGVKRVSNGCQTGVEWVSNGCQMGVKRVSNGCQMGVKRRRNVAHGGRTVPTEDCEVSTDGPSRSKP